jgi:polyisoprenoid-binding protein YceI
MLLRFPIPSFLTAALAVAVLPGCERKVDDAPKAKILEEGAKTPTSTPEPTPDEAAPPAGSLAIDAAQSEVAFVGAKVTAEHEGNFADFDGWVTLEGDTPTGLAVMVRTESVQIEPGLLARHLKSEDFFDVGDHPTARFVSTNIEATDGAKSEGDATHRITGKLDLVGVENPVVFPARISVDANTVEGVAEFSIDRKQWGIEYRGMKDDLIADDVLLKVRLSAPRG